MPVQSILALEMNFQSGVIMLNLHQTYTLLLDSSYPWMVHKHKIFFHMIIIEQDVEECSDNA